jgi:hypothetical protein
MPDAAELGKTGYEHEIKLAKKIAKAYENASRIICGHEIEPITQDQTEYFKYNSTTKKVITAVRTVPICTEFGSLIFEGELQERPNGDPGNRIGIICSDSADGKKPKERTLYSLHPFSVFGSDGKEIKQINKFYKLNKILTSTGD